MKIDPPLLLNIFKTARERSIRKKRNIAFAAARHVGTSAIDVTAFSSDFLAFDIQKKNTFFKTVKQS
jgi:hypothetical protein